MVNNTGQIKFYRPLEFLGKINIDENSKDTYF